MGSAGPHECLGASPWGQFKTKKATFRPPTGALPVRTRLNAPAPGTAALTNTFRILLGDREDQAGAGHSGQADCLRGRARGDGDGPAAANVALPFTRRAVPFGLFAETPIPVALTPYRPTPLVVAWP